MFRFQHCARILIGMVLSSSILSLPLNCQVKTADTSSANQAATITTDHQSYSRYVLQREDVLLISFSLTPELNQTVTVLPDGFINLQIAGSIHAEGLTVPELVMAVQKAYAGVLHDPIISVDLSDFQKPFFTVSGQVAKPGQYELRTKLSVSEALAVAGGMTMMTAKTQVFLFHRNTPELFEVKLVNMKEVLNGKHLSEDAFLQPGDMIYVPEKYIVKFRKYIPYSVNLGTYINPDSF